MRRRGGGIALTRKAHEFREAVRKAALEIMPQILHFPTSSETVYQLDIVLYFETLENPGWFRVDKTGQREAKTRYKVVDVDNRVKFLQDCVITALGIPNDCQVFRGSQEKREDPQNPRAEVTVQVIDAQQFLNERRP